MFRVRQLGIVVALLSAAACSAPTSNLSDIQASLKEKGYTQSRTLPNYELWVSTLSAQEPELTIIKDKDEQWRVSFIDFEFFWCRVIDSLDLHSAVNRSKAIFSQIPPHQLTHPPQDQSKAMIDKEGLSCHIGKGG